MRALLSLVLLSALAAPSGACDGWGGYGHGYRGGWGYRGWERPYWHHPYYARFGYQRPYLYYRQLRYFGHVPHATFGYGTSGGCGGGWYYTYYPAFLTVAPIYSRLGVALTLEDRVFSKADRDGLPRPRNAPVGKRFLRDVSK